MKSTFFIYQNYPLKNRFLFFFVLFVFSINWSYAQPSTYHSTSSESLKDKVSSVQRSFKKNKKAKKQSEEQVAFIFDTDVSKQISYQYLTEKKCLELVFPYEKWGGGASAYLYNEEGKIVFQTFFSEKTPRLVLPVSHLFPGNYTLELFDPNRKVVQQISWK